MHPTQILHVDDDPGVLDLTTEFVEDEDDRLTVETVTSADEALDRIADRPPDCIVSDYDMPGKSGIEFLETVRKTHPDLPFILFTGKGSESVASDAMAAGVTDYLQKGSGTEQYELLANRITNAVQGRREIESERRFIEQSLNALDDLFYVLNMDGTIRRWNSQLANITGYTGTELEGMHATELFPDDEQKGIANAIGRTLADGYAVVEADVQTADGDQIPYEWTGTRLTDADDVTTGIIGIGRDLSERRQRERQFRALVEESSDIISIVDADGYIQYQSPSVERILGYSPDETVGNTTWEYIHPDDCEAVREAFEGWISSSAARGSVEHRIRHADGSWRWLEARGTKQFDSSAVDGYIINSRDITQRKEDQRKLELIEKLFTHVQECQFIIEVADSGFKLRYANEHYKWTVGLSPEEPVTGQTPTKLFGEAGGQEILNRYNECIKKRDSITYTVEVPVPEEGTTYRTILTPVISDSEVTHIVGTARSLEDHRVKNES